MSILPRILTSLPLLALALVTHAGEPVPTGVPRTLPGGWVYAWGDEFSGSKLDEKKWAYELGVVRNPGASQAYTKNCVKVRGGKLLLLSRSKETPNATYRAGAESWNRKIRTQPYASGSVTTRGVKEFKAPGRLEFRAKIPRARGVWPAIWTMHVNSYGWPANGEIDILEHISQEPDTCYSIFRWGRNGGLQEQKVIRTTRIPNYSKEFHTYVLEWDSDIMRILIDDKEVGRVNITDAQYPNGDNPLRTPCYIIMNTAIGGPGTWPQKPVASDYPVQFEIDYVRYYTRPDADGTEKGKGAPDEASEKATPRKESRKPGTRKAPRRKRN